MRGAWISREEIIVAMAKRDDSGLTSENKHETEVSAKKDKADSAPEEVRETPETEEDSPTITMQGVSGKKITGKVRAVRAPRRVEREAAETEEEKAEDKKDAAEAQEEKAPEEPKVPSGPRKIASGSEVKRAREKAKAKEQAEAQARAAKKLAEEKAKAKEEQERLERLKPITGSGVPQKIASGSEVRQKRAEAQKERRQQRAEERKLQRKRNYARQALERAEAAKERREREEREIQERLEEAQRKAAGPQRPRSISDASADFSQGPRKLGNIKEMTKQEKAEEAKPETKQAEKPQEQKGKDKKRASGSKRAVLATQALEKRHRQEQHKDDDSEEAKEEKPKKVETKAKPEEKKRTPDAAQQVVSSRPAPPKTLDEIAQSGKISRPRKIASGSKVKDDVDPSLAETAKRFAKRKAKKEEQEEYEREKRKQRQRRKREAKDQFRRQRTMDTSDRSFSDRRHSGGRRGGRFDERSYERRRRREEQAELARQRGLTGDPRQRRKQLKKEQEAREQQAQVSHVALPETLTVKEFAEAIKKTSADVIMKLMDLGVMANLNQEIDFDTATLIADEFGITTEKIEEVTEEDILFDDSEDVEENLVPRAPVVVVMGHVDHGKTSLLDRLRKTDVVDDEAGGITQHIGASMVNYNGRQITFLDTPGHEAFTTMRARGADATDIAILVVAADDGVMPQTIEAINHAKAAEIEIIVAINKIDKPGTNPERVMQQLSAQGLVPEEWGGDTIMVPVSAKTGEGIDELMEMLLLTADVLELKADPDRQAKGVVLEARLDRSRGPVATLLVQRGTLRQGDTVVTSTVVGNIRAMTSSRGEDIEEAGPSTPVEILGLSDVPEAGEVFYQVDDEKTARQLAERRREEQREQEIGAGARMSLEALHQKMQSGEVEELKIVLKADVVGSVEAMRQSLEKLSTDEVRVDVIHGGVGGITESDIRLAEVADAIVIGFNVRPTGNVEEIAESVGVDIRLYRVIYEAIEDIQKAMAGLLEPELVEKVQGRVEIREIFHASSVGTIGGGYVTEGKITRSGKIRLIRDDVVIMEGELASLRRYQDDVREVQEGYECGLSIERFNDIKVGDIIESYVVEEVARTL